MDFADGAEGVKKFGRDLMALSERVPVAAEELTKVATAAGQFGLKEDQILPYTEMAAKVGVAFDMAAGEISQGMAEIMSGTKMTIPEVKTLTDVINHLSNNSPANLSRAIGYALLPAVREASDGLIPIIQSIRQFVHEDEALVRKIIMVTSTLIALRVAAIAAQWGFAWMRGAALMSALAGMKALRGAIWAVQLALFPFGMALRGAGSAMIAFAAASRIVGIGGALKIIGASALAALNPLRLLAGAIRLVGIALKVAFISTGVGAIIAGIAAAGVLIYNNWSGLGEMITAFGRSFMAALGPAAPIAQRVWDAVKGIWNAITGMLGPIDESGAKWRAWGQALGEVAGGGVRQLVGAINTVIGALKGAYEWASSAAGAVANFFGAGGGGPAPAATGAGAKVEARATGGPVSALRPYLVGE